MATHLLTPRERQIFEMLIKNEDTYLIANKLNIYLSNFKILYFNSSRIAWVLDETPNLQITFDI